MKTRAVRGLSPVLSHTEGRGEGGAAEGPEQGQPWGQESSQAKKVLEEEVMGSVG